MHFFETKIWKRVGLLAGIVFFVFPFFSSATDYSSGSFTVKDPVIDEGGASSASASFGLGQSTGQTAIGISTSASFQIWSGFQYFFKVDANTLNATAGDSQVSLTWTVPATFLGINVSSYEVGTGTTSGSYTFENVGNITNFIKGGLTNSTPYFFIIKALGPGGVFLVFSNEDTATPVGVAPPPPPSGGGGGGPPTGSASFSGIAYPNAAVTLVRDSQFVGTTTADASGGFSFNQVSQTAGNYSYSIYAVDADGAKSANYNFTQTISAYTTSTVSNIIVPPTLRLSHTQIRQGDAFTASGYSAPSAAVTISLAGPTAVNQPVTSAASGFFSFGFNSGPMAKGNYSASARTRVNSIDSPGSTAVAFAVGDQTVTPPPPGACGRSDLNCDGRVNLIDFSILLYFWDSTEFALNPKADIDKSGRVELVDLSIMLYDWTG